jgi:Zn-dependent peptidase ImmA (M78 family)
VNVIRVDVVTQARQMLQLLDTTRPGAVERLHDDALDELATWTDVQIRRVPDSERMPTETQPRCSVAGGYVHTTAPPTLTVTESLSRRRQQFTALHELGHHLQKNDIELAVAVRRQPADIDAFEDAACDMFASLILLPDAVLAARPDGRSPGAAEVVSLFERTQASRAACCVRVAERLGTPAWSPCSTRRAPCPSQPATATCSHQPAAAARPARRWSPQRCATAETSVSTTPTCST